MHYNIEKIRVSSPWINRIENSSKVFGVNLSREEKHEYARPRKNHVLPLIRKKEGGFLSSLKKNQASLDDFHDENGFLGRKQWYGREKKQGVQKQRSLRKNEDSLAFFYIRNYGKRISLISYVRDGF